MIPARDATVADDFTGKRIGAVLADSRPECVAAV